MIKKLLTSSSTHAQFVRYFVAAGIGLTADFFTVIVSKELLGIHYLLAACLGFTIGLVITYLLSNKIVFGTPDGNKRKLFLLFTFIGLVGLAILNLLMWLMVSGLSINYILAKVLATIVVFMWNFLARKSLYKDTVKQ